VSKRERESEKKIETKGEQQAKTEAEKNIAYRIKTHTNSVPICMSSSLSGCLLSLSLVPVLSLSLFSDWNPYACLFVLLLFPNGINFPAYFYVSFPSRNEFARPFVHPPIFNGINLPAYLPIPIERWGAGVETQKYVRGEIGGWGRVPFNETYTPSLSTIYDGA